MSAATASFVPARGTTFDPSANRPRVDAAVRTGAVVLLWSTLLLVTDWWVAGGGVQALAGWDDGLTSLGRLTGLLASGLLLVQVLLMARIPVLEHAFGQDRLARQHRIVGFTSFTLMLGHVVLITWGYAAGQLSRTPATLWELAVDYPGMLLAVAGTAWSWWSSPASGRRGGGCATGCGPAPDGAASWSGPTGRRRRPAVRPLRRRRQ